MIIEKMKLDSFVVIGKEGSTENGGNWIALLWENATEHFDEVEPLALKNELGNPVAFWGAMSDMERHFLPWEDGFSKGLYLAGVQCKMDAEPPEGWTKWMIPSFVYLRTPADDETVFAQMLRYLENEKLSLVGAVHDYIDPATGQSWMYFPIEKVE